MKRELKVPYYNLAVCEYCDYRTIPYEEGTESLRQALRPGLVREITEPFPMKRELKV